MVAVTFVTAVAAVAPGAACVRCCVRSTSVMAATIYPLGVYSQALGTEGRRPAGLRDSPTARRGAGRPPSSSGLGAVNDGLDVPYTPRRIDFVRRFFSATEARYVGTALRVGAAPASPLRGIGDDGEWTSWPPHAHR